MPITPPMKRKPTVSRSKGSLVIVEQTEATKVKTLVATSPRDVSKAAIFLSSLLIELAKYLHDLTQEP